MESEWGSCSSRNERGEGPTWRQKKRKRAGKVEPLQRAQTLQALG